MSVVCGMWGISQWKKCFKNSTLGELWYVIKERFLLSEILFSVCSSTSSNWYDVNKEDSKVDCTNLTRTECDFTANSLSEGFPRRFNISLRVRAKLGGLVSAWATAPWFEHYRNGKGTRVQIPLTFALCSLLSGTDSMRLSPASQPK